MTNVAAEMKQEAAETYRRLVIETAGGQEIDRNALKESLYLTGLSLDHFQSDVDNVQTRRQQLETFKSRTEADQERDKWRRELNQRKADFVQLRDKYDAELRALGAGIREAEEKFLEASQIASSRTQASFFLHENCSTETKTRAESARRRLTELSKERGLLLDRLDGKIWRMGNGLSEFQSNEPERAESYILEKIAELKSQLDYHKGVGNDAPAAELERELSGLRQRAAEHGAARQEIARLDVIITEQHAVIADCEHRILTDPNDVDMSVSVASTAPPVSPVPAAAKPIESRQAVVPEPATRPVAHRRPGVSKSNLECGLDTRLNDHELVELPYA